MPLYQYDHDSKPPKGCQERFEVLEGLNAPPLKKCPECGKPCHRIFSPFSAIKSVRGTLSTKNLARHGFTQYKKAGGGHYEKTCGDGPNVISGN